MTPIASSLSSSQSRRAPLVAAVLGTLFAIWLYRWRVMDPQSAAWLMHGDPAQHYLGSVFFLSEGWQWPPGLITRFGEGATSVVFTDSIPLVALVAKLLGVPAGLQYFGLWMVLCHALSAWWGVRLLQRMGVERPVAAAAGGLFFTIAPVLLMRAYGHEALMGHFLILAALERTLARWRWWPWLALGAVAVLVHPYLAVMVCTLGVAAALAAVAEGSLSVPRLLLAGTVSGAVLAGAATLAGYFAGSGEISAEGHKFFSANLLTWFDRMAWVDFMRADPVIFLQSREWSRWLPPLKQAQFGQYEGFAYLGVGALAALVLAVGASFVPRAIHAKADLPRARWAAMLVATIALALYSLSARPTVGAHVIVDIPLSELADKITGTFRASGRFIWPLTYVVMAWALMRCARFRWGPALLVLLLAVQFQDLFHKFKEFRIRFKDGPPHIEQPASDPVWARVLERCPRLELVTGPKPAERWMGAALAAARAGANFYPAPTARYSPDKAIARQQAVRDLLAQGSWREDVNYVLVGPLPEDRLMEEVLARLPAGMRHVRADGYDLVLSMRCLGQ